MFKEDEIFDLKIKSVLESGREEVPEQVWDGIRTRLNASSAPSGLRQHLRVPVWIRNSGIGLAAAAALAATVIFSGLYEKGDNTPEEMQKGIVAVAEPASDDSFPAVSGRTMTAQAAPLSEAGRDDIAARIPSDITVAESAAQEYLTDTVDTGQADRTQDTPDTGISDNNGRAAGRQTTGTKVPGVPETQSYAEENDAGMYDIFGDDSEDKSHRIRTSLTINGNAVSNTNSQRLREASIMAPGSTVTTGITEDSEGNSRYGIPVSAGAGVRLGFTPKWSMSIGLNYTYLTRTFDGTFTNAGKIPAERTRYEDIRNSQHYIGIPINFYYSIVNKNFIDLYAYAGGAVDCCISNKYTADNAGLPHLSYTGKTGSLQLSANIGLGVEFMLGDYVGIYIDPSLRYYFRNSNAPKSIRTEQPLMLGFEVGFRFRL